MSAAKAEAWLLNFSWYSRHGQGLFGVCSCVLCHILTNDDSFQGLPSHTRLLDGAHDGWIEVGGVAATV